ncbi:MAG: acyltransferase [Ruminococcus sp.]|nr:acyltransferase [Ruminococcus sp.]
MLFVVLIHCCITSITDFPEYSYNTIKGVCFYSIRNIGHFAVPCFFMISGALLLNPKKEISSEKLFKKYIFKYALSLLVFGSGFALLELLFDNRNFKAIYIAKAVVNVLQGKTWNHMWYMYALLGVMLVLPILKLITQNFNSRQVRNLIIVSMVFLSVITYFEKQFSFDFAVDFPVSSVYCIYMLMGYYFSANEVIKDKKIHILIISLCSILFVADGYLVMMKDTNYDFAAYYSPFVALFSCSVFCLFKQAMNNESNGKIAKIKNSLSECSFGIYIIHMFWINIIYKFATINPFTEPCIVKLLCIFSVTLLFSFVSVWIMKKIPFIRNLV